MSDNLSLWHIEAGLAELMEAREAYLEDAQNLYPSEELDAGLAAIDQAIKEYAAREVAKVDGIRGYLRWASVQIAAAREEAKLQAIRANQLKAGVDRLKAFCVDVMQSAGKKTIDGKMGRLSIQGNGREQPLVITDESLIPDSLCWMEGRIRADIWQKLVFSNGGGAFGGVSAHPPWDFKRAPSSTLIREALDKECTRCDGHGKYCAQCGETIECKCGDAFVEGTCHACAGTGQAGVPGAHLGERGVHLRVK
jgi:hypothetical protein